MRRRRRSQPNYLLFYEVLILCRTFNGLTLAAERETGERAREGEVVALTVNEVYLGK